MDVSYDPLNFESEKEWGLWRLQRLQADMGACVVAALHHREAAVKESIAAYRKWLRKCEEEGWI